MPGRPTSPRPSSGRSSGYRGRPRSGGSSRPARPAVASDLELALDAAADAAAAETDAPAATFASLGLPERLVTALARRELHAPFAIQTRSIPDALAGRDVLGRGATGSGKTLAFGLPLLTRLVGGERRRGTPRGLVLVPTRELAQQVQDALAPLAQALDLKVMSVYGGASMGRQIDQLRRGVDLVVATPGRLKDLIEQRECSSPRSRSPSSTRPTTWPTSASCRPCTELLDQTDAVDAAAAVLRDARPRCRQAGPPVPQGPGDPRRRHRGQPRHDDGPPRLGRAARRQDRHRRRDRLAPGPHADLRAHQARRRPPRDRSCASRASRPVPSTATSPSTPASARSTTSPPATPACSSRPTSPPAASTSTTSTWSCTSTRRPTTRTTCTAPAAPRAPAPAAPS